MQEVYKRLLYEHMQVCEWYKCFKNGLGSVESNDNLGGMQSARTKRMANLCVQLCWETTICEFSDYLSISVSSVQSILTDDLNMKHVSAKFVPKLISDQKKACTIHIPLPALTNPKLQKLKK